MSEENQPEQEPKIIVDDDWKSQVEKEKEQLKQPETGDESPAADPHEGPMELPEASFLVLLSTLGTQAMAAMGLLPDPISGNPNVNLPMAKHFIDTLEVLKEKTKGNLSEMEEAHLRDALHQLRMTFVAVSSQPTPESPAEPSSKIELP